MSSELPKLLQPALKALEKDLLARSRAAGVAGVEAGLRAAWEDETRSGETGFGFDPWRRERVTQIAVAWVLSLVFVRTLEDRGLIEPRVAGPTAEGMRAAEDRELAFTQLAPFLGPREYMLTVFRELAKLPGARDVFDARHNPVWVLSPSAEGARALLDFFRKQVDGQAVVSCGGADTRFLGDLYQDLSADVRKRYALLQTPEFVEEFILDQTLDPAVEEFGLGEVRLIDPTCGSGHFLLGAFRRLLGRWRSEHPIEPVESLAQKALDQVFGVDINPYAVAIARFRMVLAVLDAVGIKRLDKAPDLRPNVVVADSLLHRFENVQMRLSSQITLEEAASWGDGLFRLEDPASVERVLSQRYHAVVGNPPYITEKDKTRSGNYSMSYKSASGRFSLGAVFVERFFELATAGGCVGLIDTNAWTKRDYGKALVEQVLPSVDLQRIVDTSGCYVPGHGTPTLLLFGRNRAAQSHSVVAVLGKRGEGFEPPVPALAPVWSEVAANYDSVGWDGPHVSVELISREALGRHPWVLSGGGARLLLASLEQIASMRLTSLAEDIGYDTITSASELLEMTEHDYRRLGVELEVLLPQVDGDVVRDWEVLPSVSIPVVYDRSSWKLSTLDGWPGLARFLWPHRLWLGRRWVSGGTRMSDIGLPYWGIPQLAAHKHLLSYRVCFGGISTHNHFAIDRGGRVFKQTALIANLRPGLVEADHQALLGYLNSSTMGFWGRLNFFQKGGDQVGEGGRLSAAPWLRYLQMSGNMLGQLPVPDLNKLREALLDLVVSAEQTVNEMSTASPANTVTSALASAPSVAGLRAARDRMVAERLRLRSVLVSLQEEMDWRVYGLFNLPTVTAPSTDLVKVPVAPEHRPFEVRLAREVATDISASEWFRLHQRTPPADVDGPLADLYRQRLRLLDDPERGKDLRLLETPETKRRWPAPDDAKDFTEAARVWLLDRIEEVFRGQSQPELMTARQLALDLSRDPRVQAVAELLADDTGNDLNRLLSDLLDDEGVPFLSALRYTETGLEKRKGWEDTWELQRAEDQGRLEAELRSRQLQSIPVPDKYAPDDFQRHYWRPRGALDVPKERFVTVPVGNSDEDPTPLVGWAGWNHLQTAQALSGLYQRRKVDDGWVKERLVPLLAGIEERVPWLLQWHNEPSDDFGGTKLGDFIRQFVNGEAQSLGISTADLHAWRPAPAEPKTRAKRASAPAPTAEAILAALAEWKGEADAGPDDLVAVVGSTKTAVNKLLKALVESGQAEKTNGRPARYRAARISK